jgi:hypothetical protein
MTLEIKDYSLSRGLSDIADYYNAGTIVGALQDIVADAGADKKKADEELKNVIKVKYDQGASRPIRDRINRWLDSDLQKNTPIFKEWLRKQSPSIKMSPSTWVDDSATTQLMLEKAIKENNIQE